jgi:hypothetical protein
MKGFIMSVIYFSDDVEFLKNHIAINVLTSSDSDAKIIVAPGMQARVLTSCTDESSQSFGWINRELIESGERRSQINAFGGEDRFWLGPEGGQFSIFFKPGYPMDVEHWQTPEPIDWCTWEKVSGSAGSAVYNKSFNITNAFGTVFKIEANREINVLDKRAIEKALSIKLPEGVKHVGYETLNTLKNVGTNAWEKDGGLLSIWILGMMNPSPETTTIIPFKHGSEEELGPILNDAYFGKVPVDRLKIENDIAFFKCDGNYRSKIGISPLRSKAMLGSYAADTGALTIVTCSQPEGVEDYVNSMWEIQQEPFKGDVINSYNDGALTPGGEQLGPFYELESSSPAVATEPGESFTHTHRTFHFEGSKAALEQVCKAVFGISLQDIL